MARFGVPNFGRDPLAYQDSRLAGVPTVEGPRDPTVDDTNYPIQTIWRNTVTFAECILVGFISGEAQWNCFTSGSGTIFSLETDDGNQVLPNGGIIDIEGTTVANATWPKPVFTEGATANTAKIQVQVGAARTGAPGDFNDAGLVSFDDTQFAVDANGYVSLIGGSIAIDTLTGDAGGAVGPDGAGDIDIQGVTVANGSNAKPVFVQGTPGSNLLEVDVQVGVARTGAPADSNDAGLVSFDDTDFAVDANGYVTLAGGGAGQTITGDTGGALPPTAGNWNILGGPGVTTTGSGSTLTINSVVYTDQAAPTTVDSDSGSFATGAVTLTLPAAPNDGERCEFIATNGVLTIQASGTQIIHLANDSSTAGGTCTGSATGDSITLIYQASTDDWWSLGSPSGVWVLA